MFEEANVGNAKSSILEIYSQVSHQIFDNLNIPILTGYELKLVNEQSYVI